MNPRIAGLGPELGDASIPANRLRLALLTISSVGLALASGAMALSTADKFDQTAGWAGVAFFGVCAVVIAFRAVSGGGLRLTRDGFEIHYGTRKQFRKWGDVRDFQIVQMGRSNRFVGYNLTGQAHDKGIVKMGRAMSGVDALLPNALSVEPEELAILMDSWRRRYAGEARGAAERS